MPIQSSSATYKAVRGLSRGLTILEALNSSAHGYASASELGKLTGLHRTTVRRLLETLISDGFVRRSESDDSYRLTRKVRLLSEGFAAFDRVSAVAMPIMGELMQKVVWPSSLCMPDIDAMQICESTHRFSPLSFHRAMVTRRVPFLLTAAGKAYFSFCDDQERKQTTQIIQSRDDQEGRLAKDEKFIKNLLRTVRSRGYSSNIGEWEAERKVGAIAMPIRDKDRVIGSLNIVYLTSALDLAKAEKNFAGPLQIAVDRISALLTAETNSTY